MENKNCEKTLKERPERKFWNPVTYVALGVWFAAATNIFDCYRNNSNYTFRYIDYNGDGYKDIAICDYEKRMIKFYWGNNDGSYTLEKNKFVLSNLKKSLKQNAEGKQ